MNTLYKILTVIVIGGVILCIIAGTLLIFVVSLFTILFAPELRDKGLGVIGLWLFLFICWLVVDQFQFDKS